MLKYVFQLHAWKQLKRGFDKKVGFFCSWWWFWKIFLTPWIFIRCTKRDFIKVLGFIPAFNNEFEKNWLSLKYKREVNMSNKKKPPIICKTEQIRLLIGCWVGRNQFSKPQRGYGFCIKWLHKNILRCKEPF